ncbi:MAG TPA: serine/threonine-protein kinase [Polyangiaceae bacterium]|nr:serine/threonine-protein kinase [Polyangiaceae bacterium]
MNADPLKVFEEPAPHSTIRPHSSDPAEASAEPRISVEIRTVDAVESPRRPAPADYAIGQVIAGKYRVERKIGEGAMGIVLAATHLGLDEPVAIKFMRPEMQSVEGTRERFAKEAKIAARIRSEHVAKVLDVGELDALGPFIVMEYLEGKSLADLIDARALDRQAPLPVERAVEYLLQACEALAAAHAIGVIHRDVKPDNLFVTRHGGLETLKLLDFGISKAPLPNAPLHDAMSVSSQSANAGTSTTAFVMGTPLFMSPEQLRSLPDVDCRTDIWSMGAVMYELLSGAPPFQAVSIPEICAAILDATPTPLPPSCPAALQAVVMRCLEKDRERRYQSIAELASALVPFATGEARAYASRSSCILRASTLNLPGADVAPAAVGSRSARSRFQSSALVAAATVLALSALGVAISLSKVRSMPTPAERPPEASARVAPAAATPSAPMPLPAAAVPMTPAASGATSLKAPRRTAPATLTDEPSAVMSRAPERDTIAPPAARRHALLAPALETKPTRAPSRRSALPSASAVAADAAPGPADPERPGRVRLVEPRPKLRLVDRVNLVAPARRELGRLEGQR